MALLTINNFLVSKQLFIIFIRKKNNRTKKKKNGLHWLKAYTLLESAKWDIVIDLRNTILSRFVRKSHVKRLISKKENIHKVVEYCNLIDLKAKTPKIPSNSNLPSELLSFVNCRSPSYT